MKQGRSERAPPIFEEVADDGAPKNSPIEDRPQKRVRNNSRSADDMEEDELFSKENVERSIAPVARPSAHVGEPVQEDPYFNPDMEISTPPMVAAPAPEAPSDDIDIGLLANIAIEYIKLGQTIKPHVSEIYSHPRV